METEYNIEFYRKFRKFVIGYMNTMYNINVTGLENIPEGKYILAGNHLHILDSWLLIEALDEDLRFMVDQKLYRYSAWKKFFQSVGTFPIDPNNMDLNAIKTAVNLLKADEKVVIFPEGKTHRITESVPFKGGVPKISILGKSPIVPFGISGSYKPFHKLNLNFGEPIDFKTIGIPKEEYDSYLETTVRKLEKR